MFGIEDPVGGSSILTMIVVDHPSLATLLKIAFEAVWASGLTFETALERVVREPQDRMSRRRVVLGACALAALAVDDVRGSPPAARRRSRSRTSSRATSPAWRSPGDERIARLLPGHRQGELDVLRRASTARSRRPTGGARAAGARMLHDYRVLDAYAVASVAAGSPARRAALGGRPPRARRSAPLAGRAGGRPVARDDRRHRRAGTLEPGCDGRRHPHRRPRHRHRRHPSRSRRPRLPPLVERPQSAQGRRRAELPRRRLRAARRRDRRQRPRHPRRRDRDRDGRGHAARERQRPLRRHRPGRGARRRQGAHGRRRGPEQRPHRRARVGRHAGRLGAVRDRRARREHEHRLRLASRAPQHRLRHRPRQRHAEPARGSLRDALRRRGREQRPVPRQHPRVAGRGGAGAQRRRLREGLRREPRRHALRRRVRRLPAGRERLLAPAPARSRRRCQRVLLARPGGRRLAQAGRDGAGLQHRLRADAHGDGNRAGRPQPEHAHRSAVCDGQRDVDGDARHRRVAPRSCSRRTATGTGRCRPARRGSRGSPHPPTRSSAPR